MGPTARETPKRSLVARDATGLTDVIAELDQIRSQLADSQVEEPREVPDYLLKLNLRERPFETNTDPRFLWLGGHHKAVLENLQHGLIAPNGFLLLTGDVGTGKTTLVHALLERLPDNAVVGHVRDPDLEILDFLNLIAGSFGLPHTFCSKADFLIAFEKALKEAYADGALPLLVIDEAHTMSVRHLEQIRLLSNIELPRRKLLNIFLIGQDELETTLSSPACRALRQRIALHYRIGPLSEIETQEYIAHRLKVAGTDRQIFAGETACRIYRYSQGYPRVINILCDRALWEGREGNPEEIAPAVIARCAAELRLGDDTAESVPPEPQDATEGDAVPPPGIDVPAGGAEAEIPEPEEASDPTVPPEPPEVTAGEEGICEEAREEPPSAPRPDERPDPKLRRIGSVGAALLVLGVAVAFLSDKKPSTGGNPEMPATSKPEGVTVRSPPHPEGLATADRSHRPPKLPSEQEVALQPSALETARHAGEDEDSPPAGQTLGQTPAADQTGESDRPLLRAQALRARVARAGETDPDDAEDALRAAVEADPYNAKAHFALGKLYTKSKAYPKAIEAYQRAAGLDPDEPAAFFNLGFVYASTHDYANAERMFQRAVALRPTYLDEALFNLAAVQEKQGKKEQCVENLRAALAVNRDNGRAREYLDRLVGPEGGAR